jgi:hypothetical protein
MLLRPRIAIQTASQEVATSPLQGLMYFIGTDRFFVKFGKNSGGWGADNGKPEGESGTRQRRAWDPHCIAAGWPGSRRPPDRGLSAGSPGMTGEKVEGEMRILLFKS